MRSYIYCIQDFVKSINSYNKDINIREPFKNLFTQGMVCHESYKDESGNWLYPSEVEKIDKDTAIKITDKKSNYWGSRIYV